MSRHADLEWSLGKGALLGAMRQKPPGFIQNDDDLDLFMPARDVFELHDRIRFSSNNEFGVVRGVPSNSCCGYGWRLHHRDNECAYMDIFTMSLELQQVWDFPQDFSDDVAKPKVEAMLLRKENWHRRGNALLHEQQTEMDNIWRGQWTWVGPLRPWKMDEYIAEDEFRPLRQMKVYNITVNIPMNPWPILKRTYGNDCSYNDTHNHHDLRSEPEWLKPADIDLVLLYTFICR